MRKGIRYTIFRTRWGYFGLAGTEEGLLRSCLPMARRDDVKCRLLRGLDEVRFEKEFFRILQGQISAYFAGVCVSFGRDIPLVLACPERSRRDGFSPFARRILRVCRDISYGKTMSYGEAARRAGAAGGGRAAGQVLAKNPLPLIIPCHRVIYANGGLGGFNAAGGVRYKKRMLELEKRSAFLAKKRRF